MKNILFVVDENRMGGVSTLLEDMMRMVNFESSNIDILVLHDSGDKLKNIDNVNIIYGSKYFDTVDMPIKELLKSKNVKKILKKLILVFDMKTGLIKNKIIRERKKILNKEYDIEVAFKDGFTAIFTAFGNSKRKIHWLHYDYKTVNPNKKYSKLFNKILPTFDNIVAVSKGVMDDFNNIYHLENKTQVISNLVDVNKIKNLSKESNNIVNSKLNIISVGRIHPMKGYDRLISAFNMLKMENLLSNIELKIFGDGPTLEELKQQVIKYDLLDNVKLMGRTDNPYKEIKNSDLFVLPSLYEPFGLVIVEAMTLKVPVLACSNSATSELIKNNKNGMIVDNSTVGLYNGLKQMITNSKIIDEYKNNLNNYDYNENNKNIIKKIDKLFR